MANFLDGVQVTTSTAGTGDILLDGAVDGRATLAQAEAAGRFTSGLVYFYGIPDGTEWEYGEAVIEKVGSDYWLRRSTGTVTDSSDGGALLDLSGGGVPVVAFSIPDAEKLLRGDLARNGGTVVEADQDATLTGTVVVTGTARFSDAVLDVISTDPGAAAGPEIPLFRDSASPAIADEIGELTFDGRNGAAERVQYGRVYAEIRNPADGSEEGRVWISARGGASARIDSEGLSVNGTLIRTAGLLPLDVIEVGQAVAALDFTVNDADHDTYLFELYDLDPSASDELIIRSGSGGVDTGSTDYETRYTGGQGLTAAFISPFDVAHGDPIYGRVWLQLGGAKAHWQVELVAENRNYALCGAISLNTGASSIDTVRFAFAGAADFSVGSRIAQYGVVKP